VPSEPATREGRARAGLTRQHDAIIVGGGFSGVAALHVLRRRGLDVRLLEAGTDVGGVWHWNTYPGARCDTEVYDYSFAFPEIDQEWEWKRRLAHGDELQAHIAYTVDRYDLRQYIEFSARVVTATYEEDEHRWTLETESGQIYWSRATVWCTGVLSAQQMPNIAGIEDFHGVAVHTGAWPQDGVEVSGKTVGIVGTGSSGVQIIPEMAKAADRLVVFQRTANHVVPANNAPMDPEFVAELRATAAERRAIARTTGSGAWLQANPQRAFEVDDDERRAVYERHWAIGGFGMLRAFTDLMTDEDAAATADAFVREKIRESVDDPLTADKLMPGDHPFNTKRMGVGIDYYETFNREDVRLVDARTEAIDRVTRQGVLVSTGEEIPLDVIIFATGFDSFTGAMTRVDIRGRDDRSIREAWATGARTYMGLGVHGFPNLFMIGGPGGPSIFANAPITSEHAGGWIADLLVHAKDNGITEIEAEPDAEEAWTQHLIEVAEGTLYRKLRTSWYHGANTPGKKPVFMGYVGGVGVYHGKLADIEQAGYRGFSLR
jgi:cation diffusion facilitator CzcD-associated flavoprotein CzcO